MNTPISPDEDAVRNDWRRELTATPACVAIDRLGDVLSTVEQAHVASCVRCQAELAMFRAFEANEADANEGAAVAWIAHETKRRLQPEGALESARAVRSWVPKWALLAASLAMVAGTSLLVWTPSPSVSGDTAAPVYRASRVDVVEPQGDVPLAPLELRWTAVPGAVDYEVRLFEVDGTELWRTTTDAIGVALPSEVRAAALPAKTLQWTVVARDGQRRAVAESGATSFRVHVSSAPSTVPPGV